LLDSRRAREPTVASRVMARRVARGGSWGGGVCSGSSRRGSTGGAGVVARSSSSTTSTAPSAGAAGALPAPSAASGIPSAAGTDGSQSASNSSTSSSSTRGSASSATSNTTEHESHHLEHEHHLIHVDHDQRVLATLSRPRATLQTPPRPPARDRDLTLPHATRSRHAEARPSAPGGNATGPSQRRRGIPAPSLSLTHDEGCAVRAAARNIARTHYGTLGKLAAALGIIRQSTVFFMETSAAKSARASTPVKKPTSCAWSRPTPSSDSCATRRPTSRNLLSIAVTIRRSAYEEPRLGRSGSGIFDRRPCARTVS